MESTSRASNNPSYRRSRGVNWTEDETEQLLEAWSQRDIQLLLDNGPHNRLAFERVSFILSQHGIEKTPNQCREKIKKLKSLYRSMSCGQGKVSRKLQGRLQQKLQQVMGDRPTSMPSPTKEPDLIPAEQDSDGIRERQAPEDMSDNFNATFPESIGSSNGYVMDGEESISSSNHSESSTEDETSQQESNLSRKRKKNTRKNERKLGHRKTLYVLFDKLIAAQNAANQRFIALEEKRLMIDKELEEKRIEAEAKRQEAQRQHELRLLSTMAQQMANILKNVNSSTVSSAVGGPSKPHQVNGCSHDEYANATVYSSI